MYQHCETDDRWIILHDCKAEGMEFYDGTLSFVFPNGFWVTEHHPLNQTGYTVRTGGSRAEFHILDEEIDGIEIYLFKKKRNGAAIRESWETENFIRAVNDGVFRAEFIEACKEYQSFLFRCWVWFDREPFHRECEIILHSDEARYLWNELRSDCRW